MWNAEQCTRRRRDRSVAGARKRFKKSGPETPELFSVGTLVLKYFDGDGWFLGEITSNTAAYSVVYEDGDREFYTLDSEQLVEMVDNARDVTADEILLDPDADESDDTETEKNYADSELEEEFEAEEVEDDLFATRERLEEEKKEAEDALFATPNVEDKDTDEQTDEEYNSAMEEAEEAEKEEDELLSESDGNEEEGDTKEENQRPQSLPKQSKFSLFQDRLYSFFGSKTK